MSTHEDECAGVFLHGHVNDSDSLNSQECATHCPSLRMSELISSSVREAEEWLKKLRTEVHPIIEGPLVEPGTE